MVTTQFLFDGFSKFGAMDGENSFGEEMAQFLNKKGLEAQWMSGAVTGHNRRVYSICAKDGTWHNVDELDMAGFEKLPLEIRKAIEDYVIEG